MVTTRQVEESPILTRYGCVLCGQHFQLPSTPPVLPPHVYPTGLFRGRPCASTYGLPA